MKRFQNILFVKSASNNAAALAHALTLARNNRVRMTFMATPEEIPDITDDGFANDLIREARHTALESSRAELEQLAAPLREEINVEIEVVEGRPFLSIIRQVLQRDHDLVIKSTEGDEGAALERMVSRLFSTDDMHLLRKCPCPVWLVKPDQSQSIKRIIAAVDFDETGEKGEKGENKALNKQIMEMALSLAYQEKAELHVIHAWQTFPDDVIFPARSGLSKADVENYIAKVRASRERQLSELFNDAKNWVGPEVFDAVKPKSHAIKGKARQVIVEQTRALDADLLVMGTVGRTGIPGFFIGNTAESILNQIDCSVLAIKPEGFVSPVTF